MDYIKTQIKRSSSNRIKLFAVLSAIHILLFVIIISQEYNYDGGAAMLMLSFFFVFGPIALYLRFFIPAVKSYNDYTKSKLYLELGELGMGTSQCVCAAVDHEVEDTWYKNSFYKLTENWICFESSMSFKIKPFDLLCWVYIRKEGLSNCLVFRFSDGKELLIGKERTECDNVIEQIKKRYPHVILGFMEALDSVYKNNPAAFGNQRKQQITTQAATITDRGMVEQQTGTRPEPEKGFQADSGSPAKQRAFFCASCGKPLPHSADFCPECGNKVQ